MLLWLHRQAWLGHPAFLSPVAGLFAFAFAAIAAPPPALVVLALSIPFFYYAGQSRWKDCITWIIGTIPFQYYFNIGGLALTHTELYLFLFAATYLISRGIAERALILPSALLLPFLYGVAQFAPVAVGQPEPAKNAIRVLAAVFFCPRPRGRGTPRRISSASWAFSP